MKIKQQHITDDIGSKLTSDETLEEKKFRKDNETFGKLGGYAHNMIQFELSKEFIEDIIFTYAHKKKLPKNYSDFIHVYLLNTIANY